MNPYHTYFSNHDKEIFILNLTFIHSPVVRDENTTSECSKVSMTPTQEGLSRLND